MNKNNYKVYIYSNIGLFLTIAILYAIYAKPNDLMEWVSIVTRSISLLVIVSLVFVKWLWKYKLFYPWLVPFPNLEGVWSGLIKTTYQDQPQIIPLKVTITQSFFQTTVRLKTAESQSISNVAYFPTDEDGKITHLYYSYLNNPNSGVRDRSVIHFGTARLDFDHYPVTKLTGEYWTTRKSVGTIELSKQK